MPCRLWLLADSGAQLLICEPLVQEGRLGPHVGVEFAPDIVEAVFCLHVAQACPATQGPLSGRARRIQHVLLPGDAVEVPANEKVAISWYAG